MTEWDTEVDRSEEAHLQDGAGRVRGAGEGGEHVREERARHAGLRLWRQHKGSTY